MVLLRQLEKPLWEPVIDRLARVREVFAVDLPGKRESATLPPGEAPTIEALATATAAWFGSVGLERPRVAGNSLGGAVAVELARTGQVRRSVAISPIGLWTRWEAAYALGSLRLAREAAAGRVGARDEVTGVANCELRNVVAMRPSPPSFETAAGSSAPASKGPPSGPVRLGASRPVHAGRMGFRG